MGFHRYKKEQGKELYEVGDKVKTSIVHASELGYLDAGEEVTVTTVLDNPKYRAYDIQDRYGNVFYNVKTI